MITRNQYVLSKDFAEFREFIHFLPERFELIGTVIQDTRNTVKLISTPRGPIVVKKFDGMNIFNRIAYSFFRESKAARSYNYSERLLGGNVAVPQPIGWLDCYRCGFLTDSYFISLYEPLKTLQQILTEHGSLSRRLSQSLAEFAIALHHKGIYHDDFSSGNILVRDLSGPYMFLLVDLNRVKFREVGFKQGLNNLVNLPLSDKEFNVLICQYAKLEGRAHHESIRLFWKLKCRESFQYKFKQTIKEYTYRALEDLVMRRALSYFRDKR